MTVKSGKYRFIIGDRFNQEEKADSVCDLKNDSLNRPELIQSLKNH